jgi:hypothetical protein
MGSRKKKSDDPADGPTTAVAETPPEANGPHAQPAANGQSPPTGNGVHPNRPAASFAAQSDRGTRVEVAVWSKRIVITEQEEYTQYTLTLSRSWRDKDGNWFGNASFRIHDIPVLLYLVQQAYNWCLAQRTEVHVESNGDVPF